METGYFLAVHLEIVLLVAYRSLNPSGFDVSRIRIIRDITSALGKTEIGHSLQTRSALKRYGVVSDYQSWRNPFLNNSK